MDDARRQFVDRMFRARLSWTLLGGLGLLGLTADLNVALRGALLAAGLGAFIWLNRPLALWILTARRAGNADWQPMAMGMALRVVALVAVVAVSW
jgi:hypothetical protein